MESILTSIKQLLGISEADTNFDKEIVVHINTALSTLSQLGLPAFSITNATPTWAELFGTLVDVELIKSYIFLKVRLIFDPPQTSFTITSIKDEIKELEWHINDKVDPAYNSVLPDEEIEP